MDKGRDFCKFYRSNRFFEPKERHILDMAFYVYNGLPAAINTGQKSHILCNVDNSCIARSQDDYRDLI